MPSPEYDWPSRLARIGLDSPSIQQIAAPLAMLSFWAAIGIPALYIPLFVLGIDSMGDLVVFLGLFGLHLLALIGGRSYHHTGA